MLIAVLYKDFIIIGRHTLLKYIFNRWMNNAQSYIDVYWEKDTGRTNIYFIYLTFVYYDIKSDSKHLKIMVLQKFFKERVLKIYLSTMTTNCRNNIMNGHSHWNAIIFIRHFHKGKKYTNALFNYIDSCHKTAQYPLIWILSLSRLVTTDSSQTAHFHIMYFKYLCLVPYQCFSLIYSTNVDKRMSSLKPLFTSIDKARQCLCHLKVRCTFWKCKAWSIRMLRSTQAVPQTGWVF